MEVYLDTECKDLDYTVVRPAGLTDKPMQGKQFEYTLQEKKFHWNLNFVISLMANWLNFNSPNYKIFKNLLMMAYTTKPQNFLIFNSLNLTILGKFAKLDSVYIFIL